MIEGSGETYDILRADKVTLRVAESLLYNNGNYSYTWRIFLNGVEDAPLTYISVSTDEPSMIQIPAYKLLSGSTYTVTLNAVDMSILRTMTSSVYLNVIPGKIVARIFNGTETSIPKGVKAIFDASASYDTNEPIINQQMHGDSSTLPPSAVSISAMS